MIITNKLGLSQAFVNSIQNELRSEFSATSILKSPRAFWLYRRNFDIIVADASDFLKINIGTACHEFLERHTSKSEQPGRVTIEIDGFSFSGQADEITYVPDVGCKIIDFKYTSVWKYIFQEFDDWYLQLNFYKYLYNRYGFNIAEIENQLVFTDWSKSKSLNTEGYPKQPAVIVPYKPMEDEEIEDIIINKIKRLDFYRSSLDDDLPYCTKKERFMKPDHYSVIKHGRKRAIKNCESEEQAIQYIKNNNLTGCDIVKKNNSQPLKCMHYCFCKDFCNQYQEMKK
jgi:hypothetical protein